MWTFRVAASPHRVLARRRLVQGVLGDEPPGGVVRGRQESRRRPPRGPRLFRVGRRACEGNWCYSADISGSTEHIEAVARAIGAKVLTRNGTRDEALAAAMNMHWHIVAAEVEAGIIDETGAYVGELDWTRKMDVSCDWMRRHSKSRATR